MTLDEERTLIQKYSDGASQLNLAQSFGIHRTTVTAILDRHGVMRRDIATPTEAVERMPALYEQG